jgi:hypothetical protein
VHFLAQLDHWCTAKEHHPAAEVHLCLTLLLLALLYLHTGLAWLEEGEDLCAHWRLRMHTSLQLDRFCSWIAALTCDLECCTASFAEYSRFLASAKSSRAALQATQTLSAFIVPVTHMRISTLCAT